MRKRLNSETTAGFRPQQTALVVIVCLLIVVYVYRHYYPLWRFSERRAKGVSTILIDETGRISERTGDSERIICFADEPDEKILFGVPLDVNSVSATDLEKVPGIGPQISRAVIAYRMKHGPFADLEELLRVKGIGAKKFQRIKKYLTVKVVKSQETKVNF
ncbi:MAG: helix-hairpin-helix domain-containing protein [Deltaproteobacteria bacterium]|nr:helix-hairpin-helix domain-containing protein [Deltaproteobacteria bacterium]